MRSARALAALALAAGLVLASCGGDDDDGTTATDFEEADDDTPDTDAPPETEAETEITEPPIVVDPVGEEVPDPCEVIFGETIMDIVGGDPGGQTPSSINPMQRKVCTYDSGLILAIEIADNYETSVALIRENAGSAIVEDVTGVGNAAIWQDYGGSGAGQLIALGDDYFVGVSVPTEGKEIARQIAEQMLSNL